MKRILCMALVMMLALSCVGAFAADRTVYGPTTTKVDVELSVVLKYYFTWVVPGDDEDMTKGKVNWGNVGVNSVQLANTTSNIYIYANSENEFNLVHEEIKTSQIPYTMLIDGITKDITEQPLESVANTQAYFIMKTKTQALNMCQYHINEKDEDWPRDCGWYRDTVTFYCSVK